VSLSRVLVCLYDTLVRRVQENSYECDFPTNGTLDRFARLAQTFWQIETNLLAVGLYDFSLTLEREAAKQVFQRFEHLDILADKGFISATWQAEQTRQGIDVWTAKRDNQHQQNPADVDALIASYRQRIEGVFNELQNLGKT
jgi:Transposase DDE domain